jgi:hypothetical protein
MYYHTPHTGKEDGEPPDAFAQVEKKTSDKTAALETKDRLEELMEYSDARNSDPFGMAFLYQVLHLTSSPRPPLRVLLYHSLP